MGTFRLAAESDKAYQLLAHGRWFCPASSTTKASLQVHYMILNDKNNHDVWAILHNHGQATDKLYHFRLRVDCTLFVIHKAGRERTPYW
jgi:hypothetical protein